MHCKYEWEDSIFPYNTICIPLSNVQTFLHKPAVILVSLCVCARPCVSALFHSTLRRHDWALSFRTEGASCALTYSTQRVEWVCVYVCTRTHRRVSHQTEKNKKLCLSSLNKNSCIFQLNVRKKTSEIRQTVLRSDCVNVPTGLLLIICCYGLSLLSMQIKQGSLTLTLSSEE